MRGGLQHFEAGKENNSARLLFHKCKEGVVQWLYHYIFHGQRYEIDLGALTDASLKQACEWCNIMAFCFALRDVTSIKNVRNKRMRQCVLLYY